MAQIIVPNKEQWEILQELGLTTGGAKVIIRPDIADWAGIEEGYLDYEFGGECDVEMDIVASEGHYFFGEDE